MKQIALFLVMVMLSFLPIMADDTIKEGQQVTLAEDCYGTVVPETLNKLTEYSLNGNFDMFATFFKFGYAIMLDKNTPATVVKVQGDKLLLMFANNTSFWVKRIDVSKPSQPKAYRIEE